MNQYLQRAQQMAAEIVENRRYIHSHAGVGFDVGDTVDRIMSQLAEAGIQGEVCGQAGVVVTLGKPGKTILLRADTDALRSMCEKVRDKLPCSVAALCSENEGKVTLAVSVGKEAQARGLKAGVLVKEIAAVAGGKGGGKPDMAMAGIKDANKVDEALAAVPEIVKANLK